MTEEKTLTVARCSEVEDALQGESLAVMVYGSVARGTDRPNSDLDVLQVRSDRQWLYRIGRVNVSAYTPEFLAKLAGTGSLFVLHLKLDGLVQTAGRLHAKSFAEQDFL
jgi:predicted nucleotidyltransferase